MGLLTALQRGPRYAAVAGGFLRDQMLGVVPKDLDIFVSHEFTTSMLPARYALNPLADADFEKYADFAPLGPLAVWNVCDAATGEPLEVPTQIIVRSCYCDEELLHGFDLAFCQIAMCLTNRARGVTVTPGFLRDIAENTATPVEHAGARTPEARLARLKARHPTRMFVEPLGPPLDL